LSDKHIGTRTGSDPLGVLDRFARGTEILDFVFDAKVELHSRESRPIRIC
jgi:hypothetical protein